MAAEGPDFLPGGGVPQLQVAVRSRRRRGCGRRGLYATPSTASTVAAEGADFLPGGGVPELHGRRPTGGGEGAAVGAVRHTDDRPVCPRRVRISFPVAASQSFTVLSIAGGGEGAAVGAVGQAVDQSPWPRWFGLPSRWRHPRA